MPNFSANARPRRCPGLALPWRGHPSGGRDSDAAIETFWPAAGYRDVSAAVGTTSMGPIRRCAALGPPFAHLFAMTLPRTFLVPTDFSEPSDMALAYAIELAKALSGEIVLLHTFDIPIVGFPDGALVASAEMTTRITTAAQEGLDRSVAQNQAAGVPIRALLRQGEPWQAILDAAKETKADMIVVGTHGRTGIGRVLMGSVAEKVVRTATVPVLTVHPGDEAATLPVAAAAPALG